MVIFFISFSENLHQALIGNMEKKTNNIFGENTEIGNLSSKITIRKSLMIEYMHFKAKRKSLVKNEHFRQVS